MERIKLLVAALMILLAVGIGSAAWGKIQPSSSGTSDIDADKVGGRHLAEIDWVDVAMSQSDVGISDLGAADANLDMNGFNITDCGQLDGSNCNELIGSADLAQVLASGNTAGGYDIDMNGNDILNLANAEVTYVSGALDTSTLAKGQIIAYNHTIKHPATEWIYDVGNGDIADIAFGDSEYFYAAESDGDVRKWTTEAPDFDDGIKWGYDPGVEATSVSVDQYGYVYGSFADGDVAKLYQNGTVIWQFTTPTAAVNTTDVGPEADIYVGGEDNTLWRLDQDGSVVWSESYAQSIIDVTVSDSGYIYTADTGNILRKRTLDGTEVTAGDWPISVGNPITAVAADESGNVYASTAGTDDNAYKYFKNGTQQWVYTPIVEDVNDVAVDHLGYVYVVETGDDLHKIDPDGNQVWVHVLSTNAQVVDVDQTGFVYTGTDFGNLEKTQGGSYTEFFTWDGERLHQFSVGIPRGYREGN